MNKWKIRNSEGEFDLRGTKATLLIMLGVPVIVSLALVATAVMFGKPLDSAQVLTDNPGITSVSWFGYGTHGADSAGPNAGIAEPVRPAPPPPPDDEGHGLAELLTSPERSLVVGLLGSYSAW